MIRKIATGIAATVLAVFSAPPQTVAVAPQTGPAVVRDDPLQRGMWLLQRRAYPLDSIPAGAQQRAFRQLRTAEAVRAQSSNPMPTNGWTNIGPAPITDGQLGSPDPTATRPVSGRIAALAVDPSDKTHWLAGAAQGGIWESHDSGTTWVPRTDDQPSLATGAIAFAPGGVVYAGTGEANFVPHAYAGAGLLKSTDGGSSWQLLAAANFAGSSFSSIKANPSNTDVVVVATAGGIAGRGSDAPPTPPPLGVLRSTDGGISWARTLQISGYDCTDASHPTDCTEATALEMDPHNFNHQFAAIGFPVLNIQGEDRPANGANGVYRSTDGGQSWTLTTGPWSAQPSQVGRIALAIAPSNPSVLYVAIQNALQDITDEAGGGLLGIWKSTNAWTATPTFTAIPSTAYCEEFGERQCGYDNVLSVDPTNANILYAGGITLWKYDGANWTEVSQLFSNPSAGIHVDQHSLTWAGGRLIVGNDGGVWSTTDGGVTWADHNATLSTVQFYEGSVHPSNPNFALGGAQDNGTSQWTGDPAWHQVFYGDGSSSAIASSNPDTNWAVSARSGIWAIYRTTDGANFSWASSDIDVTFAPFIARFAKCPSSDDVLIAGTNDLWKTTNFFSGATPAWSLNSRDELPAFGPYFGIIGVTALAFAPSDTGCNIYAFARNAQEILLTTDGGATWTNLNTGGGVPGRYVTGLAFDPTNANVLYVTLSGFDEGTPGQPGHVFKTTDALDPSPTWSNVSPPVDIPHNTILVDPSQPALLYVGTDIGVWVSSDAGATWTHMGPESDMPNVAVFDLQKSSATGRLVAFTLGRGAFVLSGNTIATGLFEIYTDDTVLPPTFSGVATYDDLTFTPFGGPINLFRLLDMGTTDINNGVQTSFTFSSSPSSGGFGTYDEDTVSSPDMSLLSYHSSGDFVCSPAGCNSGQDDSFIGPLTNVIGSVGDTLSSLVPPGTVYTVDGTLHFITTSAPGPSLPACDPPPPLNSGHRCFAGTFGINAFAPFDTPASSNPVTVSVSANFFNSATNMTVPLTVDITYDAGVSTPGTTTVTAGSNAGGTVPANFAVRLNYCSQSGQSCSSTSECPISNEQCVIYSPPFFDISTTAGVTGIRTVCVHYPDADNDGLLDGTSIPVSALRLLHGNGSSFDNISPTGPDLANKIVCGDVTSFSSFAVGVLTQLPGGGSASTDCISEWGVGGNAAFNKRGKPLKKLVCRPGEACDSGGTPNACTFSVSVCALPPDPRFPSCFPSDIAQYRLAAPQPNARDPINAANAAAVMNALEALGPNTLSGRHLNVVTYATPVTGSVCSGTIPITVPLRTTAHGLRAGTKSLRLKAQTSSDVVDTDTLRLVCRP
jgi:photosystem II stability/assembly factor-like uncharacterized protein